MRKLLEYKDSVGKIMDVHNGKKSMDATQFRSIEKLMYEFNKDDYAQGEYDVFVKALISEPVLERIEREKKNGKCLEVQKKDGYIKIYLHATNQLREPETQINP